jgi:AcrR family transcriptional regulator
MLCGGGEKRMRVQRKDWLERGLELLAREGLNAVTIDAMCRNLEVTKGSFYHHFANREAFLEGLLSHWEEHYTMAFITFSEGGKTPTEQMERLMKIVVRNHDDSEVAIRVWAQSDPLARTYQARVDQKRMAYLAHLLKAMGTTAAEARTRAQMLYTMLVGAQTVVPALTRDELRAMYLQLESLTGLFHKE